MKLNEVKSRETTEPWAREMEDVMKKVVRGIRFGLGGMASDEGFAVSEQNAQKLEDVLAVKYKKKVKSGNVIFFYNKNCGVSINKDEEFPGKRFLNWFAPENVSEETKKRPKLVYLKWDELSKLWNKTKDLKGATVKTGLTSGMRASELTVFHVDGYTLVETGGEAQNAEPYLYKGTFTAQQVLKWYKSPNKTDF